MKSFTATLFVLFLSFDCLLANFMNEWMMGKKQKRNWESLSIKYDSNVFVGFKTLPRFQGMIDFKKFVKVEPEEGFKIKVELFCLPNDPRVCIMFDLRQVLAGVQISFLRSEFDKVNANHYDFENNPNFVKTNFFNMPAYTFRIFFTNPVLLTKIGGIPIMPEMAEGIWVYLDGILQQVPTEQPEGDKFDNFHKQGCLTAMGLHYFYNLNKDVVSCNKLTPFFVTYENKRLVGFGLYVFGKGLQPYNDWYEFFPKNEIELMVPDRPQCFNKLYGEYQLITTHVYLVLAPNTIHCDGN